MMLLRLLMAALDKLPDHRVEVTDATFQAMAAKYAPAGQPEGGLLLRNEDGTLSAALADHEAKAVLIDRAAKRGYMLLESDGMVVGLGPAGEL